MSTLSNTPYYGGGQVPNPANVLVSQTTPNTADIHHNLGTLFVDENSESIYALVGKTNGVAAWTVLGGSSSSLNTLTGTTGTATPTAGNIQIAGGDTITTAASGSIVSLETTINGYPITPYVVGPIGFGGYQTIQSAIDAANAAGGGAVFINHGTYTENLILHNGVSLTAVEGNVDNQNVKIIGTHTPDPGNGTMTFKELNFFGTTSIFLSAAIGQGYLSFEECNWSLSQDGYIFDMLNWVGPTGLVTGPAGVAVMGCGDLSLGASGFVRNSAGMQCNLINSYIGSYTSGSATLPLLVSGHLEISISDIYCPINISGGIDSFIEDCGIHGVAVTVSGTSSGYITNNAFTGLSDPAFTMSSSGNWVISSTTIETSNNPAIAGAGAGVLTISGVDFIDNSTIANTLTLGTGASISPSLIVNNGNLTLSQAGTGFVTQVTTASGAASGSVTCNGRVGAVTFTGVNIASGANGTFTMANSSITGSGTAILYSISGATTAAGLTIQSVTNSAGQSVIVVTNTGPGLTAQVGDVTFTFLVLN